MSKLRVESLAVSIEGFGAGPNQNDENPLGERGPELMGWFFHISVESRARGAGGETGIYNDVA